EKYDPAADWNLDYNIGTFGGLKYFAWKYFDKYGEDDLATLYQDIYEAWQQAFDLKTIADMADPATREAIATALKTAQAKEEKALGAMKNRLYS
ncbi:MAG: hypothetical protein FWD16_03670, partial [Clostridia bacterium]|nr:hypothetical protein [Clostridia bacterium]